MFSRNRLVHPWIYHKTLLGIFSKEERLLSYDTKEPHDKAVYSSRHEILCRRSNHWFYRKRLCRRPYIAEERTLIDSFEVWSKTNSKKVNSSLQEQDCQSKSSKFNDICIRTDFAICSRNQKFQNTLGKNSQFSIEYIFS